MQAEIILIGRPATKKNSQQVVKARTKEGKIYHRPIPSKAYEAYEEACLWQLKTYRGPKFDTEVNLQARYYMPDKRSWPDLSGLIQATCDILEAGGVITNDRLVASFDGSYIVGVDKYNPRVDVVLREVGE